jgi:hypothetical protein
LNCLSPHQALPDAHTEKHEIERELAVCREGGRPGIRVHARNKQAVSIYERERQGLKRAGICQRIKEMRMLLHSDACASSYS